MNIVDRIIEPFAPGWALNRAKARAALGMVRAYEGASRDRRTSGWRVSSAGPVTEVRNGRQLLRDRSRDLVRSNAWMSRAVDVKSANLIGTGIRPRANGPDAGLNKDIDALFAEWSDGCAPESGRDFYGLQDLSVRSRIESGESLIIKDRTGSVQPAGVALTLQVLEPDWLADNDGSNLTRDGWVEGIQFDTRGMRVAYRLWNGNPNESGFIQRRDYREVPAADVIHLFRQLRPGQIRGVPDVSSTLLRMRDLDDYHAAALMLAKVQSILGVFVTSPAQQTASPIGVEGTDAAGNRTEDLSPGMVAYLPPGTEPHFLNPSGNGPFKDYTRGVLHQIAAGLGMTYHQLTGDLSDANYSSLRAGKLEFRRQVEQEQWLLLIPTLCMPVWAEFIRMAVLARRLPPQAAGVKAIWTPPRFEMVDPNKDSEAIKTMVRTGLMTWPQAVAEQGYDPNQQLDEIKTWNGKMKDAGVVLDIDPRLQTGNGNAVNPAATASTVLNAG